MGGGGRRLTDDQLLSDKYSLSLLKLLQICNSLPSISQTHIFFICTLQNNQSWTSSLVLLHPTPISFEPQHHSTLISTSSPLTRTPFKEPKPSNSTKMQYFVKIIGLVCNFLFVYDFFFIDFIGFFYSDGHAYFNAYTELSCVLHSRKILRHKPGDWIEGVGGLKPTDYEIPEVTTLLLVGLRGSGKSSLVNRISRVFEEDKFAPDRAQVSHNLSVTIGSCFFQEYMVPRNSKSLCFYDSRSLSTCKSENFPMLNNWMTQGVSHGQMVMRDSDTVLMRSNVRAMARQHRNCPCPKRFINFVIFVVDGAAVLKSMDNKDAEYDGMLVESFNYPYLSFKDDKPVVVVTHGNKLSFYERARILTHLGEILGIPPSKQNFDIPDSNDLNTELAIVDMLRYSIEHADRNLPYNTTCSLQVRRMVESFHFNDWVMLLEFIIIFACLVFCYFRIASWLMKDYFGLEHAV